MGALKTSNEKEILKAKKKERSRVKRLVLDMNDDVAYYKGLVQQLSQEVIDFVNLIALTKKTLIADEGSSDEHKTVLMAIDKILDAYLQGSHNNALTHKGSDIDPNEVKKVDMFLKELEKDAKEDAKA